MIWQADVYKRQISLILGSDHKKMSKRHGATSVQAYRDMGYLPDAMVNYLALLGWAPKGEQELFTREEPVSYTQLLGAKKKRRPAAVWRLRSA